ncbi:MAG: CotH kinase family protein [Ignavibacteriales bacterium]|nr:CotH kinase family protein [Ignavibacteriales bacterium]
MNQNSFKIFIVLTVISIRIFSQSNSLDKLQDLYSPPQTAQIDTSLIPPQFSAEGGFYNSSFYLELNPIQSTENVFYTLDGSEPTNNSTKYINKILIAKTTVVRACSFISDSLRSKSVTHTYFINEKTTLQIFSISTNPENLWDNNYGIYVFGDSANPVYPYFGANFWQDWERPIHVELFEPDGSLAFSIDAGVKIYGTYGRAQNQKSLAIFARNKYGFKNINYKFFNNLPLDKFESIVLRNSGNDWNNTMLRDALMHSLINNTGVDVLAYHPAVVFINGEYWGIHDIREKVNEHYIASHHDLNPDSINILETDGSVVTGSNVDYKSLMNFISKYDINNPAIYNYIKSKIDIDEYISYLVSQIYFDNTDWPGNNIKFWCPQSPSGKWRWILYDTDFGFGLFDQFAYKHNMLEDATAANGPNWPNPPWSTLLLRKLLVSTEFKNNFITRFSDYANSIFIADTVIKKIKQFKNNIEPEITRHLKRWNGGTLTDWNKRVAVLENFADKRVIFMLSHFAQKFNLSGVATVSVNSFPENAGRIVLNSLTLNDFPWRGNYFLGIPIKLTAVPNAGYKFKEWTGVDDTNSSTISLALSNNVSVTALFEVDSTNTSVVINEINYNSASSFDTEDWVELYNCSSSSIDIFDWVFKDGDDTHSFVIPKRTMVGSDQYLVLCRDTSKFSALFPNVKNRIGNFNFGLNSEGEKIRLYDNNLNIADSLTYKNNSAWPTEPDGKGATLELKNPHQDNSLPQNWGASFTKGTPGKINDAFTSIGEELNSSIPDDFFLYQNYPNPFNSSTIIKWHLANHSHTSLKIFDVLGNEVATLLNSEKGPGEYSLDFDASNLPDGKPGLTSGIYFYCLETLSGTKSKKMVYLK